MDPIQPEVLQTCFESPFAGVYEVFAHPDTARYLLRNGMIVDGRPATVVFVDVYPIGWQLRIQLDGDRVSDDSYAWIEQEAVCV